MNLYECCKNCEFRHFLCHADCPEKAKADAKMQALKEARKEGIKVREYAIAKKEKKLKERRHQEKK